MPIDRVINFGDFHMEQTCNDLGTHNMPPTKKLLLVRQLSSNHPAFTENAIRALIYASKSRKRSASKSGVADIPGNGLAHAIIKLGRRVLIDEQAFLEWVNSHAMARVSKGGPLDELPRNKRRVPNSSADATSSFQRHAV